MSSPQSPLFLPRHVLLPGAWWLGGVASSLLAAWSGAQATERPAPPAALSAEDRALIERLKQRYGVESMTQLIRLALRLMDEQGQKANDERR